MSLHWTEEQYQDYIGQHPPKRNKYGNQKITIDGITRDSLAESNRLEQLKILERVGAIKNLQFQVPFVLIKNSRAKTETKELLNILPISFMTSSRQTAHISISLKIARAEKPKTT